MIPVDQALETICQSAKAITDVETVSLDESLGRVLSVDLSSPIAVPPYDNSAMDGYAFRKDDLHDPQPVPSQHLPISQRIMAGQAPKPLKPGTVARIFTGAVIPEGADAVVMQEQCETDGETVLIPTDCPRGNNIRRAGDDIATGATVLSRGELLTPSAIGLAASIGLNKIPVIRRLRVAVISTGDELVEPGQPLQSGQIYNSNTYMLRAMLRKLGADVIELPAVEDTLEATIETFKNAAHQSDLIISSGGVSVGEADHVKTATEQLGNIDFWRIAIKPGKPLAFGDVSGTPFFGLPGNPVSSYVTFMLFATPFIKRLQGRNIAPLQSLSIPANFERTKDSIRQEYLRVRITRDHQMDTFSNQSSGVLSSTHWANALAVVPPHTKITRGENVQVLPIEQFLK